MKPTVKLSEVVEYIEMAGDSADTFYNELTGEFYFYSDFGGDNRDLDEEEGWLRLPSQRDAGEYDMMSNFAYTVKNPRKREQLEIALSGRAAFRRFKDAVIREGVEQAWYSFRDRRYLEFAREWCDAEEVPYEPAELPDDETESEPETGIFVGKSASIATTVDATNTAAEVKSGALDVFATPSMIAIMELAACAALADGLEDGQTFVGTLINVEHTAASPIGAKITATATITGINGRKVEFEVTAGDGAGEIGRGTHERVIVDAERFMAKVRARK
jgi:predicted thioesterase